MVKELIKNIDAKFILRNVNQLSIFAKYLDIPEDEIQYSIVFKKNINSPLRVDYTPSVGFRYAGIKGDDKYFTDYYKFGKLRMKDFLASTYQANRVFWGDCFDLVGLLIDEDATNPKSFITILLHIAKTFNLIDGEAEEIDYKIIDLGDAVYNQRINIPILTREWNQHDEAYWSKYDIPIRLLKHYKVFPIWKYWVNKSIDYTPNYVYSYNDPCYCYYFGKDENGVQKIKLYLPNRKKDNFKFIANCNEVQGWNQLKDKEILLVTKSMKDLLTLKIYSFFLWETINKLQVIAPFSETGFLDIDKCIYLMRNFEHRFVMMDYDYAGIRQMNYLKREFGFKPIYFKNRIPVKDFSDYVSTFGKQKGINLFKETCKTLNIEQ